MQFNAKCLCSNPFRIIAYKLSEYTDHSSSDFFTVCIFRDSTTGSPVDHQKMTTESNKQKVPIFQFP